MWLPLQLAAEITCTCFPLLCMYLLLAQIDNNNDNAHFGYVHHLNNRHGPRKVWRQSRGCTADGTSVQICREHLLDACYL